MNNRDMPVIDCIAVQLDHLKERYGLNEDYLLSRYLSAAELLPRHLKEKTYRLDKEDMLAAEELRLRTVSGLSVLCGGREIFLDTFGIQPRELADIVCEAAGCSLHTVAENIREGFVTAESGHRIGLCGTAAVRDDKIVGISSYSSLAIRISMEITTAAEGLPEKLNIAGRPGSVLVISPPGGGKTTLVRDLVRRISYGGVRVSIADERGELAAMKGGSPQFDVGRCTDVMDMAPRSEAALYLIRAMNPQVLAMDEISAAREAEAVRAAYGCGTAILATAHSGSLNELYEKPCYMALMNDRIFDFVIEISGGGTERAYKITRLRDGQC